MRNLLIFIALILTTLGTTQAQSDNLNRLLREREQIIKDYEYYNAQNSNFWGKKSKKDLLRIIDALKGIINKDSEIIREINTVNLKKQAQITVEKNKIENQVVDDKRVVNDNFYALKAQLQSMQNQQKVKQRQVNEIQERLNNARDKNLELQQLLAFMVVVLLGLTVYIFTLRSKLSRKKV